MICGMASYAVDEYLCTFHARPNDCCLNTVIRVLTISNVYQRPRLLFVILVPMLLVILVPISLVILIPMLLVII